MIQVYVHIIEITFALSVIILKELKNEREDETRHQLMSDR